MSFFQIVDVVMNSNGNRLGGPSNLGGSQYQSNTYRYPEDIGSFDKGHYILFNINEQKNTQFPGTQTSDEPTIVQNMRDLESRRGVTNLGGAVAKGFDMGEKGLEALRTQLNQTEIGKSTVNAIGLVAQSGQKMIDQIPGANNMLKDVSQFKKNINGNFLRTIQRTTDTIALYMPDTLSFTNSQAYKQMQLGGDLMTAQGAGAVLSSLGEKGASAPIATFLAKGLGQKTGTAGQALSTAATGVVNNPMLEVIYSQPTLRTFSFSFMFYPRNEKEALKVQEILERFRFHQSPEIKSNTGGFFLIPPSEFDISFMYNGKVNPNIDKISTCVLQNISVNYAPKGFQAYEVAGENDPQLGRTGMPVGIGLTLSFMETQIITKEYYTQDSYNSIDDYLNRSGYYDPYNQESVKSDSPPI